MTSAKLIPANAPRIFIDEDGDLSLYRPECKYLDRIVHLPATYQGFMKLKDILENLRELENVDRLMAKRTGREDDFVPTYDLLQIAKEWEKAGGQIEKMPPCKSAATIEEDKRKRTRTTKDDKLLDAAGVDDDFINELELDI